MGKLGSKTRKEKSRSPSLDLMVDHPHYCPSCGAQYYVSGGLINVGRGKRKRLYEVYGNSESEAYISNKPTCPSCLVGLISLYHLEEVFGEEIRSF